MAHGVAPPRRPSAWTRMLRALRAIWGGPAPQLPSTPPAPTLSDASPSDSPAALAELPSGVNPGPWEGAEAAASADADVARTALLDRLYATLDGVQAEGDRQFIQRLIRECSGRKLDFPLFPDVALQLDSVLRGKEPPVADVLRLVRRDPDLVRRVWQQASGAQFGRKAETLEEALMRLGYNHIWRIGMGACMNAPVFRVRGFQGEVNHVRAVGIVAGEVAHTVCPTGDAYLAGLLHGVGKLLVYRAAAVRPDAPAPSPALVTQVAQRHHPSIGVLVADSWNLGQGVALAVGGWPAEGLVSLPEHTVARAVRAACIASHAAAEARAGREVGGVMAIVRMDGSPALDAGKLIAKANAAWDGLSEGETAA